VLAETIREDETKDEASESSYTNKIDPESNRVGAQKTAKHQNYTNREKQANAHIERLLSHTMFLAHMCVQTSGHQVAHEEYRGCPITSAIISFLSD
jgi:hypothetical protein